MSQEVANSNNETVSHKRRENIILSSLLFNKECREYSIQNRIPTEYFEQEQIKKILDIFNGLVSSNLPPTLNMLIEQYYPKDEDEINRKKLHKSLESLKSSCPPVQIDLFKEHLKLLKKHKKLEALSQVISVAQNKIAKEKNNPSFEETNETFDFLEQELDKVLEDFTAEEIKALNLSDGLLKQVETINVRRQNPEVSETVKTGYSALDNLFSGGGFQKKNISLISARPGMGKTVFMLNQAVEAAIQGEKVVFISLEMDLEQCLQRIISKISGIQMKYILQPELLDDASLNTLTEASNEAAKLYGNRIFIEEHTTITVPQLDSRIKFYQKHFGVELVFVDYVQIMRTKNGKTPKEQTDFSEISSDLREVAKSTEASIVLGSQLSRDVEKRDDKRPMDSDLKNSGSFEQDAATIIHLYRDAVYNKDTEYKNILEVIIGKNRFGTPNETLYFSYDYSRQTIYQNAPVSA